MPSVEYRGMNLVVPDNDSEWREHFALARSHRLMLRACRACGLMRYPPSHGCPWCQALEWDWREVSGRGAIYSYEIVVHAIQPGFKEWTPYPVVLVELDEQRGVPTEHEALRLIANLVTPEVSGPRSGRRSPSASASASSHRTSPRTSRCPSSP